MYLFCSGSEQKYGGATRSMVSFKRPVSTTIVCKATLVLLTCHFHGFTKQQLFTNRYKTYFTAQIIISLTICISIQKDCITENPSMNTKDLWYMTCFPSRNFYFWQ